MTTVTFRNAEVRLSEALKTTRAAVSGHAVTLRELLGLVGEQGLLIFCAILAVPFVLPVTVPFMSTALGAPMLVIAWAIVKNRVPWLPDRMLDRGLPGDTVQLVLERAARAAAQFEHLVRPRLLRLTATDGINSVNGIVLSIAVLLLMIPLPLVPFNNTLPAIAIILLCLGLTERDGALVLLGYVSTVAAAGYLGGLLWLAANAGSNLDVAWRAMASVFERLF
jgi:hypothetical protein